MFNFTKILSIAIFILAGIGLLVPDVEARNKKSDFSKVTIPKGCKRLVFSDEFDKDGPVDTTKWNFQLGYYNPSETQYYTTQNAWCEDSKLIIEARNDSLVIDGKLIPVTSSRLNTKGKAAWKYGYVEIRAKIPSFLGSFPALWMGPQEKIYGSGPASTDSGEIDIMEHIGWDPEKMFFTAHSNKYNPVNGVQMHREAVLPDCTDGFHVYGLRHTPKQLIWYYDGKPIYTLNKEKNADWTTWPFDNEFYLIMNLAIGGGWAGKKGIDLSALPARMEVDYVRVFE